MNEYDEYIQLIADLTAIPEQQRNALREADREGVAQLRDATRRLHDIESSWKSVSSHYGRIHNEIYRMAMTTHSEMEDTLPTRPQSPQQVEHMLRSFEQELSSLKKSWEWVANSKSNVVEPEDAPPTPPPVPQTPAGRSDERPPAASTENKNTGFIGFGVVVLLILMIAAFFLLN